MSTAATQIHDPPLDDESTPSLDYAEQETAVADGETPDEVLAGLPKRERDRERGKPGRRGGLLGRGSARKASNLAAKFGYLSELNSAAKAGEEYAMPRGPGESPAKLSGEMPSKVAQITSSMQMVTFSVRSKSQARRNYKFVTVHPWRGLMIPIELAALTAIPDGRWPQHTWYKTPDEVAGEHDVRQAARLVIQAWEEVHQGTLPQKPTPADRPKAEMVSFGVISKARTSRRYTFLTQAGYAGLWAENRTLNTEDQYPADRDYPSYFRAAEPDKLTGRVAVIAAARRMVETHEGIKSVPSGIEGEVGVPATSRGDNYTIYLRSDDIENLQTVKEHLLKIDVLLGGNAKAVQIALRELARKIRRGGTIDGRDA